MSECQQNISRDFIFEVPMIGRTVSDDGWEEVDQRHIGIWKDARTSLGVRTIKRDRHELRLQVSWLPAIRRLQHQYKVMQRLDAARGKPEEVKILHEFRQTSIKVPIRVDTTSEYERADRAPRLEAVAECFLYDVFLIMNIAAPGSCNFYNAVLRSKRDSTVEISLSGAPFEVATLRAPVHHWPIPKTIPLEAVCKWYFATRTDFAQVPRNRMEKVFFGLLHISASDLSPNTVIWLFYALETLFDTRAGENFRGLVDRVRLLLSPSDKELNIIRKSLRTMYDLRSAFVHGGLEVIHPMHNEILDRAVDEKYRVVMEVCDFGMTLLLAVIQEVVVRQWSEPKFKEMLHGVALPS